MGFIEDKLRFLRHETSTGLQLNELDAYRGWACIGVLLVHCASDGSRWKQYAYGSGIIGKLFIWPIKQGLIGVDLFFVLSGFLLFIRFGKSYYENTAMPSKLEFFKRRFFRIAPAYYVSLILLFLLYGKLFIADELDNAGLPDLAAHLLFGQNLFSEYSISMNPVFWTLATEAQYYIILPFIASWFFGRRWLISLPLIILASTLYKVGAVELSNYITGSSRVAFPMPPFNQLIWRLDQFAIGICFANLWTYLNSRDSRYQFLKGRSAGNIMVGAGFLLLIAVLVLRNYTRVISPDGLGMWGEILWSPLIALSFGTLIFGSLHAGRVRRIIANPYIQFMGIISYSLYIWHFVVVKELVARVPAFSGAGLAVFLSFMAAVFVLSTLIALVSYMCFERPFVRNTPGLWRLLLQPVSLAAKKAD